jgi:putative FmdB family regulatory protein
MPTYEYVCLACNRRFSVRQSIGEHDKHRAKCPKCGSKKLKQLVEPFFAITSKKS